MGKIIWLGSSPYYKPFLPTNPRYTLPLSEDFVLQSAFHRHPSTLGPSKFSAIATTSRLALRVALSPTGLNPPWWPFQFGPPGTKILKSPASALSAGVCYQTLPGEVEILRDYCPDLATIGVVEESVGTEQWEVDGVVVSNQTHFFRPLLQVWDRPNGRILQYLPLEWPQGLRNVTNIALESLQINNSTFCFEFRREGLKWYLIDAHCRLGEDPGLAEAMTPCGDPLGDIEKFVDRTDGEG